jgi:hypothetical protein
MTVDGTRGVDGDHLYRLGDRRRAGEDRPPTLAELVEAIDSTRATAERLAGEFNDALALAAVALALYRDALRAHNAAIDQYRQHR